MSGTTAPVVVAPLPGQAVTNAQFRSDKPEFADTTKFPDSEVSMFLTMASSAMDPVRWGQFYVFGVELWAAHFLTVSAISQAATAAGGFPGQVPGPKTTKSVGGVSYSYGEYITANPKDAQWNMSTYGKQWVTFRNLAGAGGTAIGAGAGYPGTILVPII